MWPTGWIPFDRPSEAAGFQQELARVLRAGHPLFGLPLRAIGRRWDSTEVLFALEDGTGRVASVILSWKRRPMESPSPGHLVYETFEKWARTAEWAMTLARFKPATDIAPKWKVGDRILMIRHSDWRREARGTIVREGRPRIVFDGSTRIEYVIEFDELQTDLTDEEAGVLIEYGGTTVLEEFLRPSDAGQCPTAENPSE